jgi:23S rRNA (cytidine1920-2'-O)/16S rRNA (cytidine1409-2'-O)-methyltransferase
MNLRERADVAMVRRGLAESREKAQAQIMAGLVFANLRKIQKPSDAVAEEETLSVRGSVHPFVSRGGLKLEKALDTFGADVSGAVAMDIGAATGGFTDVLLRRGAAHVYAIDVGYGQLDWELRNHCKVTVMERTNARYLKPEQFDKKPDITVMDVSFISIRLILPVAAGIMGESGQFFTLIKPQFEAGRDRVGKKGVVRDPAVHQAVLEEIVDFAPSFGFHVKGLTFSPITGPEGNMEFLAHIAPKRGDTTEISREYIKKVVDEAHFTLKK